MERLTQLYHGHFVRLDTMNIDISSQLLRQWIQEGKSLRYYVPDPVVALYQGTSYLYIDAKGGPEYQWLNTIL